MMKLKQKLEENRLGERIPKFLKKFKTYYFYIKAKWQKPSVGETNGEIFENIGNFLSLKN